MIESLKFGNLRKRDLIQKRYNEIYNHEMAHKRAGGSLAGEIVIEKDGDGIPVGGHVGIKMPVLDPGNPDKTIKDAETVISSALAPSDPSSQDYKVANEANNILFQAKNAKRKRLNYFA